MTEISAARKGEYFRALFELLMASSDGLLGRDAIKEVANQLSLTPYELEVMPSGATRFQTNLVFGTVDMVKAGWMLKQKGRWSVTEQGRLAYDTFSSSVFYSQASKLYRVWRNSQPSLVTGDAAGETDDVVASEKSVQITYDQADEQAWTEIVSHLGNMPPSEFQELVASLLRAMGYYVAWVAPPGKDGGIDILAWNDPLGARPPRIKVQVKRWSQNIDVSGLRSFMAVVGEDDVGIFVTTSGFTKDAWEEARKQERRKITLIDLERLFGLWVEHYPKLDDAARRRFPLQPIYFLAPGN